MRVTISLLVFLQTLFYIPFYASSCDVLPKADLAIYSFDRPMQLYALLESLDAYVTGLGEVAVIYRASDEQFDEAYERVKKYFPSAIFLQQGNNPHADFKPLTLQAVFSSSHDYILFAVDDNIVKGFIDVATSIEQMERYNAYGVYFRMGLHLSYCYPRQCKQSVPAYKVLDGDLCSWCFRDGQFGWKYPHTVDMTLYRKKDIERDLRTMSYTNPNFFEAAWACRTRSILHKTGLFYQVSKVVNLPINKVQTVYNNVHMNAFSPAELLALFNDDLKINIVPLFNVKNISAHMKYVPTFVERNDA